jgi:hypothetical protein
LGSWEQKHGSTEDDSELVKEEPKVVFTGEEASGR